jgi:hypothetical protein
VGRDGGAEIGRGSGMGRDASGRGDVTHRVASRWGSVAGGAASGRGSETGRATFGRGAVAGSAASGRRSETGRATFDRGSVAGTAASGRRAGRGLMVRGPRGICLDGRSEGIREAAGLLNWVLGWGGRQAVGGGSPGRRPGAGRKGRSPFAGADGRQRVCLSEDTEEPTRRFPRTGAGA